MGPIIEAVKSMEDISHFHKDLMHHAYIWSPIKQQPTIYLFRTSNIYNFFIYLNQNKISVLVESIHKWLKADNPVKTLQLSSSPLFSEAVSKIKVVSTLKCCSF